ncbi:sigma-70 family RNA polymerase sigma factor [Terriglobus albidus]|uniref:RNA polymerase sigma factor n=1 Tax=Terriglobus albidus TaxID=1592106 RepID=A0A5B9E9M4_9BACT|nr:sigma-70 family RNA polymerase sigma factor [Terriglobus albidus]QEE28872.1 sigma-70 family RNA polymerase sigma factor [Terriglobus albidus]
MIAYQPSNNLVKNGNECGKEDSDCLLVERAQDGDVHAFERLVLRYQQRVFRIILSITREREDTEDLVQETLLRAQRGLYEFRRQSKFSTWLTRIAVNQALGYLRKKRQHHNISLDNCADGEGGYMTLDIQEWRPNPEQSCAQTEAKLNVRAKIAMLPDGLRSALILKHFYGHSLEYVAEKLGITIPAAKSRILRARQRLRSQLGKQPSFVAREPSIKLIKCTIDS